MDYRNKTITFFFLCVFFAKARAFVLQIPLTQSCTESDHINVADILSRLTLLGKISTRPYPETRLEASKFCKYIKSLNIFYILKTCQLNHY